MRGKTCVITGATSGIGLIAAERLAEQGARLVLVGRDPKRGAATIAAIRKRTPSADLTIYYADLSLLSEMRRVANEIAAAEKHIDVLVNNAGALFNKREVTKDGLEMTFALNHMGYFIITDILKQRLIESAPSRVVVTASGAHRRATLDFDDLQSAKDYSGFYVYSRSKLANVLFTRELARRLRGTGVTANSLHPGFVNTRFGDNNPGFAGVGIGLAKKLTGISPEKGAETITMLASDPSVEGKTGLYYSEGRLATPSPAGQDDESARRLWDASEKIAAGHI